MNLASMYSLANSKSGYSRSDAEIYDALNEAGFRVYTATLKEFRGFFIKFDETSLTLTPGTTEYPLPVDLTQIVHLSERIDATSDWSPMAPLTANDALANLQDAVGWDDFYSDAYGGPSAFGYYGPYLSSDETTGLQTQTIRVAPEIDQNRACQLAYTAKWLPITSGSSLLMLPDEGTYAMLNYSIAELRRASDDAEAAADYENKGQAHLDSYLSWLRARQIQAPQTVQTYGPSF